MCQYNIFEKIICSMIVSKKKGIYFWINKDCVDKFIHCLDGIINVTIRKYGLYVY